MTKALVTDRRRSLELLRRVPAGFRFLTSPSSAKNAGRQDYPAALARLEWFGAATGPVLYAMSATRRRRQGRSDEVAGTAPRPATVGPTP
jgi:hypothetical protein